MFSDDTMLYPVMCHWNDGTTCLYQSFIHLNRNEAMRMQCTRRHCCRWHTSGLRVDDSTDLLEIVYIVIYRTVCQHIHICKQRSRHEHCEKYSEVKQVMARGFHTMHSDVHELNFVYKARHWAVEGREGVATFLERNYLCDNELDC